MKPADIDWNNFENAVYEVAVQCLNFLDSNPPNGAIYSIGVEGMIEEGVISIGANTEQFRNSDSQWWMPDWTLRHLDERLDIDPITTIFQPLAQNIAAIDYEKHPIETFEELTRFFRLGCLKAIKRIEVEAQNFTFKKTSDFSLMYMDSADAFYLGTSIDEGIKILS